MDIINIWNVVLPLVYNMSTSIGSKTGIACDLV